MKKSVPALTFAILLASLILLAGTACLLGSAGTLALTDPIVTQIRIPRILAAIVVGIALGAAGTALQALFRNPLAEPSLIGVSSGGALGAICAFCFAGTPIFLVPVAAFAGALAVTILVLAMLKMLGDWGIGGAILVGVAVNALAAAALGFILFFCDDLQLRGYTFWALGSFNFADWQTLVPAIFGVPAGVAGLIFCGKNLDILSLGEREAFYAGVPVERTKTAVVACSALVVALAISLSGIIGFVGLIAPHFVRLICGPANRWLIVNSALAGAILLLAADSAIRVFCAQGELPIGVLTAIIGVPAFLAILCSRARKGVLR